MPITINGSGTVTGISAGGLPDGVITRPEMGYAGAVLQVVNATYSVIASNSTSTYADTGLSATITPTSASSKVLVLVNQAGCAKANASTQMRLRLLRGTTELIEFEKEGGYTGAATYNSFGSCSCVYLDSPSTTSAITYKTQLHSATNIASVAVQASASTSTITLMEIAA